MMKLLGTLLFFILLPVGGAPLLAQSEAVDLAATWEVDTPDGRQQIIVRLDSSASFNQEIVRWRVHDHKLYIAFGDEWVGYDFELGRKTLTLSGGDLEEPITLDRVGPPMPLPDGVAIPPAPPFNPAAG